MITIKGIYENGIVRLLEAPPVTGSQNVLITFIEGPDEEARRNVTQYQYTDAFKQYLEEPNEDIYQDYLKPKDEDR